MLRYDGDDFVAFIYFFFFMKVRKEELCLFKKNKKKKSVYEIAALKGPGQIGTGTFMLSSGIGYKEFFFLRLEAKD